MSRSVKDVLQHEYSTIQTNINRIKPHCPNGGGNRDVLNLQFEHLAMVEALLSIADDPDLAGELCREWLCRAQDTHMRVSEGHLHDPKRNDIWWQTKDQIQYLSYLLCRIQNYWRANGADYCR